MGTSMATARSREGVGERSSLMALKLFAWREKVGVRASGQGKGRSQGQGKS